MFRPVFLFLAVSFAAACSGAETQDVLREISSSSSPPAGSGPSSDPNGSPDNGGSDNPDANDGTCDLEREPNDDERDANVLTGATCGKLSRQDKKDFLRFRLKPTTTRMELRFTGSLRLRVEVPGQDRAEMTPEHQDPVPVVKDVDYSVEVTPLDDTRDIDWRVWIVEN